MVKTGDVRASREAQKAELRATFAKRSKADLAAALFLQVTPEP